MDPPTNEQLLSNVTSTEIDEIIGASEINSAHAPSPQPPATTTGLPPKPLESNVSSQGHARYESFSRSRFSTASTFDEQTVQDILEEPPLAWAAEADQSFPITDVAEESTAELDSALAEHHERPTVNGIHAEEALTTPSVGDITLESQTSMEEAAEPATKSQQEHVPDEVIPPVVTAEELELETTPAAAMAPQVDDADVETPVITGSESPLVPVKGLDSVAADQEADHELTPSLPEPHTNGTTFADQESSMDVVGASEVQQQEPCAALPTSAEHTVDPFGPTTDDWMADEASDVRSSADAATISNLRSDFFSEDNDAQSHDPFGEVGDDWLGNTEEQDVQASVETVRPDAATTSSETGQLEGTEDDVEDAWAKAFGDSSEDLDAAWGAALGDDDDDGDFLADMPASGLAPSSTTTSAVPTAQRAVSQPLTTGSTSRYAAPQAAVAAQPSIPPAPSVQTRAVSTSSGPPEGMKFFEDLPLTQTVRVKRPKPPPPQSAPTPPPSGGPTRAAPPTTSSGPLPVTQQVQLHPPERLPLFPPQPSSANAPTQTMQVPRVPSSRYSPAPAGEPRRASSGAPPPPQASRYSPIPPSQRSVSDQTAAPSASPSQTIETPDEPSSNTTSAPKPIPQPPPMRKDSRYSPTAQSSPPDFPRAPSNSSTYASLSAQAPAPPPNRFAPRTSSPLAHSSAPQHKLPAAPLAPSISNTSSGTPDDPLSEILSAPSQRRPPRQTSYAARPSSQQSNAPPSRPRTQSPEIMKTKFAPTFTPLARSTSTVTSPIAFNATPAVQDISMIHQATNTDESSFIRPEGELADDILQRWKGSPVFCWNRSGAISTMFPKQVPRYGGGQSAPMIRCMASDVRIHKMKEVLPLDDLLMTFPGPLKSKNKKKDLLAWMSLHIEALQRQVNNSQMAGMDARDDERLALWQLARIFIEHDGMVAGNPSVDMAVRQVLVLDTTLMSPSSAHDAVPSQAQADSAPSAVITDIKRHLAQGDREKAAWLAADHRLWGHAMLISSTVPGTLWKQVSQEFIRKEVRSTQSNNQSLAALYATFAGNCEESIDELVPASARAGFTMMNKADASAQSQGTLEGLDKWRETVNFVLSNRSSEDEKTMLALGKLLAKYGRIEAAHICFLFARTSVVFSGADDTNAHFSLIGADVSDSAYEASRDLEAIILSEIYEYGLTLNTSSHGPIPHLQAYKLHHAYSLAECGMRNEAQQYCEAIAAALKSSTRASPYYNTTLITQLDDLMKSLAQAPKDSSSGLFSKPSIGKVSGSFWNKFNTFVSGDEPDNASNASGASAEDNRTFEKWTGGTPTISRTGSVADIYGMQSAPKAMPPPSNSRYAPGAPPSRASSDQMKPYAPYQQQEASMLHFGSGPAMASVYRPMSQNSSRPASEPADSFEVGSHRSQDSYMPSAPEEESTTSFTGYTPSLAPSESFRTFAPSPLAANDTQSSFDNLDMDSKINGDAIGANGLGNYVSPSNDFDSSDGGYQPPTGGYEPPSSGYVPFEPEPEPAEDDAPKPKKKSFMDNDDEDDGMSARAAELKKAAEKAQRDRENEELIRKAAEADAARDKEKRGSGWFGGWFNKKDPNMPTVHRAKLGEENAFVFDPETKRWVNKKAGAAQTPTAATPPPPPRMSAPPSRNVSSTSTPPMTMGAGASPTPPPSGGAPPPMSTRPPGPPIGSRSATPASVAGDAPTLPPSGPPMGPPAGIAPPSRPSTSMSNASSIDDLLGVPAPRKAGAARKTKKKTGYIDVMAK